MDDKKLFKLGIAAAVMAVLSFVVSIPRNDKSSEVAPNTPLIQGFDTSIIAAIEISGLGKNTRIVNNGDGFVVESKENYPALYSEVNNLIVQCLDMKVSEFVTSNADNFADLKVMDSNADRLIKFFDKDGKLITGIAVGKRDENGGGTFVRKLNPDEKAVSKVFLTEKVGWINTNPTSYVEKRLLECTRNDLVKVDVTTPAGSYTIAGVKDGENVTPELKADTPEGKELKRTVVSNVFDAAKNISFTDMETAEKSDKSLKFDYKYVVDTADQTEITLQIAKGKVDNAEKYFVKASSKYLNKEFMDKVKSGSLQVSKDKKAMEDADQNLQTYQAVQDFNTRHKDWVYIMEPYQATKMIKNLDEMFEDVKKDESEDAAGPVPAIQQ